MADAGFAPPFGQPIKHEALAEGEWGVGHDIHCCTGRGVIFDLLRLAAAVVLVAGALYAAYAVGRFVEQKVREPDPALERERREVRESARREVERVRNQIRMGGGGVTLHHLDAAYERLIEVSS